MVTLKIPYKSNDEFKPFLTNLRREYSSLVRYSYNRLKDGISEKDIRILHKSLNSVSNIDAWTKQCSINEAKQILNKNGENKVIFGGKSNTIKYLKGLINKETYKDKRLLPLNIFGEANSGNRKFNLDNLEIARRGYECIIKRSKQFYPEILQQPRITYRNRDFESFLFSF